MPTMIDVADWAATWGAWAPLDERTVLDLACIVTRDEDGALEYSLGHDGYTAVTLPVTPEHVMALARMVLTLQQQKAAP